MVTLIVRLPKYCSRSSGVSSDKRPASFCSAVRHSSAVVMRIAVCMTRPSDREASAAPSLQVGSNTSARTKPAVEDQGYSTAAGHAVEARGGDRVTGPANREPTAPRRGGGWNPRLTGGGGCQAGGERT